ncbi:MAG: PilZ domain-containing protein [Alphaproteobacteria bacterium]|nr:PilZ domain-containing protein [Alphaproteobacteria bacterium]
MAKASRETDLPDPMDDDMKDMRRYPRVPIELEARFMTPDGQEHQASVRDISAGGVAFISEIRPEIGSRIIAYVTDIGRLEGLAVRHTSTGFAIEIDAPATKRERLIERLNWHSSGGQTNGGPADGRRFMRVRVDHSACIQLEDGSEIACTVIDMSLSGASLGVSVFPPIGTAVQVGRMRGHVVRHHPHGIAVKFDNIPPTPGSLSTRLLGTEPQV